MALPTLAQPKSIPPACSSATVPPTVLQMLLAGPRASLAMPTWKLNGDRDGGQGQYTTPLVILSFVPVDSLPLPEAHFLSTDLDLYVGWVTVCLKKKEYEVWRQLELD